MCYMNLLSVAHFQKDWKAVHWSGEFWSEKLDWYETEHSNFGNVQIFNDQSD